MPGRHPATETAAGAKQSGVDRKLATVIKAVFNISEICPIERMAACAGIVQRSGGVAVNVYPPHIRIALQKISFR